MPGRVEVGDAAARAENVLFVEGVVDLPARTALAENNTCQFVCRAITSHAQKHFIKLLLKGEDLPPAVAVTGHGFTLSGALGVEDACSRVL